MACRGSGVQIPSTPPKNLRESGGFYIFYPFTPILWEVMPSEGLNFFLHPLDSKYKSVNASKQRICRILYLEMGGGMRHLPTEAVLFPGIIETLATALQGSAFNDAQDGKRIISLFGVFCLFRQIAIDIRSF